MTDNLLLQIALILIGAKFAGMFFERILGQSAVIGELLFGVLVGRSVLGLVDGSAPVVSALATLGSVFLLFSVGIECDLSDLLKVGREAAVVALIGIAVTLGLGLLALRACGIVGLPAFFTAAAISATSIGITARVFTDFRFLGHRESNLVLSAAVIDDLVGLAILTALSSVILTNSVDVRAIATEALVADGFLVAAVFAGFWLAPRLLRLGRVLQTQSTLAIAAIVFCFTFAGFAQTVKLAPILGAFAAGLVLNRVEGKVHFEVQIKGLADFFVPIFFVVMGSNLDIRTLDPTTPAGRATLLMGGLLAGVATVAKLIAGLLTPARNVARWIIGAGLVPRGEVTLVFASLGLVSRVIPASTYSAILCVVFCTTIVTPLLLRPLITVTDSHQ